MADTLGKVIDMHKEGLSDLEIISRLRQEGFSETDINDALNQSNVKSAVESSAQPATTQQAVPPQIPSPPPAPDQFPPQNQDTNMQGMEKSVFVTNQSALISTEARLEQ